MKKLILVISIALLSQFTYSQVIVNDENINDLDIDYIQLIGVNKSMFGVKIEIYVDYGQKAKFMKADNMKDDSGNAMKFNSMVDALNFMKKNGWEYVDYTESVINNKLKYVYLLKKQ